VCRELIRIIKKHLFVVSYFPKATVQTAIGRVMLVIQTLGMNMTTDETILAATELSILITASFGNWAILRMGNCVLSA